MADRQMVSVDAKALRSILSALIGPPHLMREIQMTRGIGALTGDDPIQTLVDDFNAAVSAQGQTDQQKGDGRGFDEQHAQALRDLTALRGQFAVAVDLLRECLGPLEVSATVIESDDGEQMEALIERVRKFVAAASIQGHASTTGDGQQ